MYANAHGGKASPEDFVPGESEPVATCPELESAVWRKWAEDHNKRGG